MNSVKWLFFAALACIGALNNNAVAQVATVQCIPSTSCGSSFKGTNLGMDQYVLVAGYFSSGDNGGGEFQNIGACSTKTPTGNVNLGSTVINHVSSVSGIVVGSLITDSSGALPQGEQVANIQTIPVNQILLTIPAIGGPVTSDSLTVTPDNTGSLLTNPPSGDCFARVSTTGSPKEWGAVEDGATDDTVALQAWLGSNQPHIGAPGNSVISRALVCNGNISTFSGPQRSGAIELNSPLPLFTITANNSGGYLTGSAMLLMNSAGCAIHDVGLIADGSGAFDTVDVQNPYGFPTQAQGSLVDGAYLFGGKVNFNCMSAGEDVEIFDSYVASSYNDDIDSNCPNFRVVRNVIAQAGKVTSSGTVVAGVDIALTGSSDTIITNNTIETATSDGVYLNGAQKVRFANNYVDRNGNKVAGGVALRNNGSDFVTVCDNVFSDTGSATVPIPVAHIFLAGTVESMKLCGNVYYTDNAGDEALMYPNYVYDADPAAVLTNIDISEKASPADLGVFSSTAAALGLAATVSPHVWQNSLNGFGLSDASVGMTAILNIAAGDVPDNSNSFPITLSVVAPATYACRVNFAHNGAGGIDTGPVSGNTLYYIYAISGPEGSSPNCMASLTAPSAGGPTFVNAGASYTIQTTANTTAGSPVLWNVGQTTPGPHGTSATGWPIKGMAIGNAVTDSSGYLPAAAQVAGLSSFYYAAANCSVTNGSAVITCPSGPPVPSQVDLNMFLTAKQACVGCAGHGQSVFPGTSTPLVNSTTFTCSGNPCVTANTNANVSAGPVALAITGNLSITLNSSTVSTSSTTDTIMVYAGYYRLIGYATTNGGHSDFSWLSPARNPSGVSASITNPTTAGTCASPASVTVPGASVGSNQTVVVTPESTPPAGLFWNANISGTNAVILNVCALKSIASGSNSYIVTLLQ